MSDSGQPQELRAAPIVGGIVLGVGVCMVWITATLFVGFGTAYGSGSDVPAVLGIVAAVLPVVLAVVLLARPRTRQLGAGFLMGISVGLIVGAGACATVFVPGLL